MQVTLITEAYNITEGQSTSALRRTIAFIDRYLMAHPDAEALLLDSSEEQLAKPLLNDSHSSWRYLCKPDAGYDQLKDYAAEEARGDYLCYLDGDCIPQSTDWVDLILQPILEGKSEAVGGFTIYEGDSALAHACSILDFGFLLDGIDSHLGCYASNNIAFTRRLRLASRPPKTDMRCTCYAHAQQLIREGVFIHFEPKARVYHELPSVKKERFRRGYDHISSSWTDPLVFTTPMLEGSEKDVMQRFQTVMLDLAHQWHLSYRNLVQLDESIHLEISQLLPRLVGLERFGLRQAYREGVSTGKSQQALAAYPAVKVEPPLLKRFRRKLKRVIRRITSSR
ncbi:MAG: glycosyltransferase [Verrucomicrobiota bacterium]